MRTTMLFDASITVAGAVALSDRPSAVAVHVMVWLPVSRCAAVGFDEPSTPARSDAQLIVSGTSGRPNESSTVALSVTCSVVRYLPRYGLMMRKVRPLLGVVLVPTVA